MFADVAVNRAVSATFTYHVPDFLAGKLMPGQLVRVSFRTAHESAVVLRLHNEIPNFETKDVLALLDPQPVMTEVQVELAWWLAENTHTPIGQCLWLMLPPGLAPKGDSLYKLIDQDAEGATNTEKHLISLLKRRGGLKSKQIEFATSTKGWRKAAKNLVEQGILEEQPVFAPSHVRPKLVRTARLNIPPDKVDAVATRLGSESKRANILEVLWTSLQREIPINILLEKAGCTTQSPLKELVKSSDVEILKETKTVRLLLDDKAVYKRILDLRNAHTELAILKLLAKLGRDVEASTIYEKTNATLLHLNRLQEDDFVTLSESEVWRDAIAEENQHFVLDTAPLLTAEQLAIWKPIASHLEKQYWQQENGVFLIHGVTGSGKTEIYMQAVQKILEQRRQAIILVPEIALTTQMIKRFVSRFPGKVGLVHSLLSPGERYDTWRRARTGELPIIIGARSALFTALPDVGLIVLDEEHDDSYKQSPPVDAPYYHARAAAIEYMRLNNGTVLLGSATPDVTSYFKSQQGDYRLLELPKRVLAHREKLVQQTRQLHLEEIQYEPINGTDATGLPLPPVQVVDMRQELRAGNTSVFSRRLRTDLHKVLDAGNQAILFLNRRGTATYVFCRDCGYIAKCPNCETPLTYHGAYGQLRCHHCGASAPNPTVCPECKSHRIKYFGQGTEQIERILKEEFPNARVQRWDQDTASQKGAHQQIFNDFMNHRTNVLIGTQMIAKGLDLPRVTLVGIISGDTALGLPDYRANERTFQLLTQVSGRAGRGPLGGHVILQTYQPEHYAIQAAANHDFQAFYEREVEYRRALRWPPFVRLARVLVQNRIPEEAKADAEHVANRLKERIDTLQLTATELIGPVPCFFGRIDNWFRWHVLVRTMNPVALFENFEVGTGCTLDIDPVDIL